MLILILLISVLRPDLLDEIASSSDFEKRIMEKAEDLASLGHPHYAKTKQAHQRPLLEAISNALPA